MFKANMELELKLTEHTTVTITVPGKGLQWVLKLVGKSLMRNRMIILPPGIFCKAFINYKGQTSSFPEEKPGRCHPTQAIKVNIVETKTSCACQCDALRTQPLSVESIPQMHNSNLFIKYKTQIEGLSRNIWLVLFIKCQGS